MARTDGIPEKDGSGAKTRDPASRQPEDPRGQNDELPLWITRTGAHARLNTVRLAVDIGGTFTDLVVIDETGEISNVKVPTTPRDPSKGFLSAVAEFLRTKHTNPRHVRLMIHATTLASNALLTRTIPRTILVTTKGFRDVLEIGRQNRPELYNLQVERPTPLVPRRDRLEVDERMQYNGTVLRRISLTDSRQVAQRIHQSKVKSVAVSFLHSYANPTHERIFEKILRRACPEVRVTLSSRLLPEFREYERTSTAVVNACLQPVVSEYLEKLIQGLAKNGIAAPLYMMQSNGGTISSSQAIDEPARVIESGPVAGAVAARYYGDLAKAKNVISLDVGGTTSKAGVWTEGQFATTTEYEVGGRLHGIHRLEGSGYPVRFPQVDLVEVGTGGGSIATVDQQGVLHVGPESAGADPGPACYGMGGKLPTVTDANLVLGRLSQDHPLAGSLRIQSALAERAIKSSVANRLRMSVQTSAHSILRIAIDNMARALRAASVERGRDPRDMLLVAFGGAGPMHACEVARQLRIKTVLVPLGAGLFSSLGLLLALPSRDYVQTLLIPLKKVSVRDLEMRFQQMEDQGMKSLVEQGVPAREIRFTRYLDLRYSGQAFELPVRVPRKLGRKALENAWRKFHSSHFLKYGYFDKTSSLQLVNLRMTCEAESTGPRMNHQYSSRRTMPEPKTRRIVTYLDEGRRQTPVYDRSGMVRGFVARGPALLDDYDSTVVIPPRSRFKIDSYGSLLIRLA